MARNSAGLTLGFLGLGDIEEASALALLDDLVGAVPEDAEIKAIFPLTEDLFTDSMVAIGNHLFEANVPYEVVCDDAASKSKSLAEWISDASKSTKAAAVAEKVIGLLEKAEGGTLIVIWKDDDGVSEEMTILAQEKGVRVLDLQQGLEEIELQQGEDGGEAPAEETPAEGGDEEGSDEPYTREELEAIEDVEDLKAICEANEIEIPPRSRKSTYINAILAAQDEAAAAPEEPQDGAGGDDDEREVPEAPAAQEKPQRERQVNEEGMETVLLSEDDWEGFRDMAEGIVEDVVQQVTAVFQEKLDRINQSLGTLGINVDKLSMKMNPKAEPQDVASRMVDDTPPSTGVRKAAGATKSAAPKAVDTEGMTEDEAREIIDEWGGRRGRPSVEVTKARAVLGLDQPQPKRPVGRPRKSA